MGLALITVLIFMSLFLALGWAREIHYRKKLESANKTYEAFIEIFKKDRDKWKAIATCALTRRTA